MKDEHGVVEKQIYWSWGRGIVKGRVTVQWLGRKRKSEFGDMDEMGESEDIPDTDVGQQSLGLPTTAAAAILQKTAWEQTMLALQQLGVSLCN